MKNCSPPRANSNLINYYTQDNCDCQCHYPEDYEINQNQIICQNIHTVHSVSPCHSHSPSPDRIRPSKHKSQQIQNIQSNNINAGCLCVCENICSCPCHCVTCVCCPCVKDRPQTTVNADNYYKTLYTQIKTELEFEKRRNDRMQYDKQLHKNNLQNAEKDKKNLLYENEQLKNKLSEVMARLEQEEDKNNKRDEELYNYYKTLYTQIKTELEFEKSRRS